MSMLAFTGVLRNNGLEGHKLIPVNPKSGPTLNAEPLSCSTALIMSDEWQEGKYITELRFL